MYTQWTFLEGSMSQQELSWLKDMVFAALKMHCQYNEEYLAKIIRFL